MQKVYSQEMEIATAGMLADISVKVTDAFAAEEAVNAGVAVVRGTNANQIKIIAEAGACVGITQFVHKEVAEPYYPKFYSVPVVTKGRVYVAVDGAVTAGTVAKFDASNGVWSASSGIAVSNVKFLTSTTAKGFAVVEIA